MKTIIYNSKLLGMASLIFVTSLSGFTMAQEQKPSTELERFEASVGDVLVKGFQSVGTLSCLYRTSGEVSVVILDNPTTGHRVKGLKVEATGSGQYDSTKTSFVDSSEIDSLIAGINYIEGITAESTPLNNLEATYNTEGGLEISRYTSRDGLRNAITVGKYSSEICFLREGGLESAKQKFVEAKTLLEGL